MARVSIGPPTIPDGRISRVAPLGWWPYARASATCYTVWQLISPLGSFCLRVPLGPIAALAAVACLAVEFLQLTEINVELLKVPVLRWFLGSTFSWHDIACYLVGIAVIVGVDAFLSKRWFLK